ncbi:hypothetical protein [Cytobacillus praedii]|uniref:hypothetical protein n=1 Tax=Cytobacillus praedii TaxID=1742358 RepID=UPI00070F7EFC|nr:hypothetical protein [Cytobacillus praedii]
MDRKTQYRLQFGLLVLKVDYFVGGIPKDVIRELVSFKRLFSTMVTDERLGKIAANDVIIADLLIRYADAFNSGDKLKAAELKKQAEAKWRETDVLINALCDKEGGKY